MNSKNKYDVHSASATEFINHDEIAETLEWAENNKDNKQLIADIMKKAEERKGLTHREASLLLKGGNKQELFHLARQIKSDFYGNRIVLFAPLYLSNHCINGCVYCPYHAGNAGMPRRKLSQEEIRDEVIALQDMGHKRLAVEAGEHPEESPISYILESIETIYGTKHKNGAIRRVNVNIAATTVDEYKMLHDAEIGTYILFQETYDKRQYELLHPSGPKSDYAWHTEAMDRAMQGGINDVGLGVLFGLSDYYYEFAALLMHAEHLEEKFGVGPHTISVPRIRSATGISTSRFKGIDDETFELIVAVIRIAAPYTGIIVSTRESELCRERLLNVGVSQISGGSRTSVGGYSEYSEKAEQNTKQFDINDSRTLGEVVRWLIETGHIPSFCTACYKEGRTGDRFMELCKSRQIHNCCHPNALMTLQEYLIDYSDGDTAAMGEELIKREIPHILNDNVKELTLSHLDKIKAGERDFRI